MRFARSIATLAAAALFGIAGPAAAFCGFFVSGADAKLYNNASQVVLMRKGNHTVMTMSNNYKGPPEDFAMVVPVPVVLQKEQVKTLSDGVFKRVDDLSAPRLVEYWERDPCAPREMEIMKKDGMPRRGRAEAAGAAAEKSDLGVTIEAKFEVGEYQILILSAKDSTGLDKWLRLNKYNIPAGADAALAPYIRDQMKFFVAKVDIKKVKKDSHGLVVLSPLRFGFDAPELRLPVRLGLLNAPSENKQDLIVYVLSPDSRYEAANYPNVFVPTNIEVADSVRHGFGPFYAELFDETLRKSNNKAVVTEYSWQTTGCDPCPTPPLQEAELHILGDDQIFPGAAGTDPEGATQLQSTAGAGAGAGAAPPPPPPAMPSRRRAVFGGGSSWVLTRLHTRYDRETLKEDLIFRAARPVIGGRANWDGTVGDQAAVVSQQDGGVNSFQGRYIIRHYWEGAVSCSEPHYGIWGGPPGSGRYGKPPASPATDLANAPRGQVKLGAVIQSAVPSLGIAAKKRPLRPGETR